MTRVSELIFNSLMTPDGPWSYPAKGLMNNAAAAEAWLRTQDLLVKMQKD